MTTDRMTLQEFIDRIELYEHREKFEKFSGLGAMYDFLDDMGWVERLRMRLLVWWYTKGEKRAGLLKAFDMHKQMKRAIKRGAGLPHADGD